MRSQQLLAALAFIWAVASASADEASDATRQQVLAITQQLMDALPLGKTDAWQRFVADDAMITDEFGRRQTKAEAIAGMHPFPAGVSGSIELRDARVHAYGDTAVLDVEEYETENFFGQKFVVRYEAMNTFVCRDGEWKVVAMQDVTRPTPPPALDVNTVRLADYPARYVYAPDRVWDFSEENGKLVWRTRPGQPAHALDAMAKDVFMGGDDEKNIFIFRRDENGNVVALIERRKFNDLLLRRDTRAH